MADESSARDRQLILIELNEINFDVAARYAATSKLPALEKLLAGSSIRTTAESQYEALEPWIQWPSAHSGLTAAEHRIFRLGDVVHSHAPQIFEQLERKGLRVGAISAMNAENRLREPAYFIPDPWTQTPSDGSWWSRALTAAVSQAVNDNSKDAITPRSATHLAMALLRFAQPKHYGTFLRLLAGSRAKSWRKALLLDLLLHDIHLHMFRARDPNFSTLFLNAGAHIQHHYFFNARAIRDQLPLRNPQWYIDEELDPVGEMLQIYDLILEDYLSMSDVEVIVATGLSQCPYDRVKFYYRLMDHSSFMREIGIECRAVLPRMTRDFLLEFSDATQARAAQQRLESVTVGPDVKLFGEIDNRGASLFVTLTYPQEITRATKYRLDGKDMDLSPHVVFVAIKNGMHQSKGFAFFTPRLAGHAPQDGAHVKELYRTITNYFGAQADRSSQQHVEA
jgi:hypothetical protein